MDEKGVFLEKIMLKKISSVWGFLRHLFTIIYSYLDEVPKKK